MEINIYVVIKEYHTYRKKPAAYDTLKCVEPANYYSRAVEAAMYPGVIVGHVPATHFRLDLLRREARTMSTILEF